MYYVNPSAYKGITVVPSEIINRCLKMASVVQLKVILAVCTRAAEGFDAEMISAITGIKKEEVEDCLIFWQEEGLLTEGEDITLVSGNSAPAETTAQPTVEETPPATEKVTETKKVIIENRPDKLTRVQIAARLGESQELRDLMDELQRRLGRLIGTNDQSSFILLHDYYGLSSAIIAMICEYARIHGRANNINYIYKIGVDWSYREIDTVEAASAELARLEASGQHWEQFLKATENAFPSKPTDKQRDTVTKWINDWHITNEIISLAFEEMKNNGVKTSIAYMDKVITNWYNAGATTPQKVDEYKKAFEEKKLTAAGTKKRPSKPAVGNGNESASYDIDKAVEKATTTVPTVRKREKR